jgi:hypothetical protein
MSRSIDEAGQLWAVRACNGNFMPPPSIDGEWIPIDAIS